MKTNFIFSNWFNCDLCGQRMELAYSLEREELNEGLKKKKIKLKLENKTDFELCESCYKKIFWNT